MEFHFPFNIPLWTPCLWKAYSVLSGKMLYLFLSMSSHGEGSDHVL
ncbi:hypothetical protein B4135_3825 [Caldibacillus debilis]|uniref:Uncharacterized protein n=1 Tax=Caldibacillus debilis TaxID=301148 RepID=A0A150LAX7_9BACI|nr:hypothetical protein B4135_3825 [Caldibacillus debilis]